ncbi:GNAT family N-acetyltransferase [Flavobacterium sp. CAU 1735]|uniref:GNAT family N-acetyltransferase n=1 Tax=Flavobacterium sp. CAU 1735 TaxID=3140361 RepID=UPI00326055A1
MNTIEIRAIKKSDNATVAALIRNVLVEHDVPKVGTAYADTALDCMFETYAVPRSVYFVALVNGKIIGTAGIAPLANGSAAICELQKMYFLPKSRGLGLGAAMMEKCLEQAKALGFAQCYLETLPNMEAARKLYERTGFYYLDTPLGNTGHSSCPIWMIKDL